MILTGFSCENFRNISSANLTFEEGVNLLFGNNAQGKTNAMEGIYLFARGKSFRGASDKELLKFGEEGFKIKVNYIDKSGNHSLEYIYYGGERRRTKDGYKLDKITEMIGNFRAVLFTPDDLCLVKAGPEERRAFLNVAISQCFPIYVKYYNSYKKALEERNFLLKKNARGDFVDRDEIIAWSKTLAEYASVIYKERKEYVKKLSEKASALLSSMTEDKDILSLSYKSDVFCEDDDTEKIKERYFEKFTSEIDREMIVGTTLFGPTHDDIEILINGKSARNFASQGQARSVVLAMKCAEGEVIKEVIGEYPVFLFDDVLSELDEKRQNFVLSGMEQKQILISTCEKDRIENATVKIEVEGGRYVSSRR